MRGGGSQAAEHPGHTQLHLHGASLGTCKKDQGQGRADTGTPVHTALFTTAQMWMQLKGHQELNT